MRRDDPLSTDIDMLFVFNRMNAIHIAWNSRGPSARRQNNQGGNGRVTFIRTWSAG